MSIFAVYSFGENGKQDEKRLRETNNSVCNRKRKEIRTNSRKSIRMLSILLFIITSINKRKTNLILYLTASLNNAFLVSYFVLYYVYA